jgi:hypothetical protein
MSRKIPTLLLTIGAILQTVPVQAANSQPPTASRP